VNWLILQVVNKTREFTGNEIAMILTGHGDFVINERIPVFKTCLATSPNAVARVEHNGTGSR
jgi:hypothetical protein